MENAVLFLRQRLRLGEPVAASVRLRSAPVKAKPIAAKPPFWGPLPRLASVVRNRCLLGHGEEFGGDQCRLESLRHESRLS